jgi:hypothetical protein
MYAVHVPVGPSWTLMLHGNAFAQYIADGSDRGDDQFGSVNWLMGMLHGPVAGGAFQLRAMMSAEPLTVGKCGYPDLLATGEFCNGEPIHDRQHPHDLFMELSANYAHEITPNVAFELYGAPVGEPALGPVAYPHRISAMPGPIAPIGHHWEDATHISFGVATAGLYGRTWKVEGSLFNGREPDENRYDFDFAPLDSYSGRLWYLPSERWALQVSAGQLNEAEPGRDGGAAEDVARTTASATYHRPLAGESYWANTLVLGQNRHGGQSTGAVLLESSLDLNEKNLFFGRVEMVGKTGEDLAIEDQAQTFGERVFTTGKLALGYVRQFAGARTLLPGIGVQGSLNFVPGSLDRFYGSTVSPGVAVFVSLRPQRMAGMGGMDETMPGMTGMAADTHSTGHGVVPPSE